MKTIWKRTITAALAAALVIPTGVATANKDADQVLQAIPYYETHTLAGSGELGLTDGVNASAAFRLPAAAAVSKDGKIYVSDPGNQRIRLIAAGKTSTAAGLDIGIDAFGNLEGAFADGPAAAAFFNEPAGLTFDGNGRLLIADAGNHAIRALGTNGQVVTIAGDGNIGLLDGPAAKAQFYYPMDMAVAANGVIYVADTLNHVIRKIEKGVVTTLTAPSDRIVEYLPGAVEYVGDYADGPIGKSKFNEPSGLAIDGKGNLYVSDTGNHRIRYIDFAKGTVSTVAGGKSVSYGETEAYATGGYANGKADLAQFNMPKGITLTPDGGLLIADSKNHVIRYLKDGNVTTTAGVAGETSRLDGVSAFAGFNAPSDVAWLGNGAFVVTDYGNNRVRVVKPYSKPLGLKKDGSINLLFGSKLLVSDVQPILDKGTTFVPLRVVSEELGYKINYKAGTATLTLNDTTYVVTNGSKQVKKTVGAVTTNVEIPIPAFIKNGRLFVPVRFFATEADLDVKWLGADRAVLIRAKTI